MQGHLKNPSDRSTQDRSTQDSKVFKCLFCPSLFSFKFQRLLHMQWHLNHPCCQCGKAWPTQKALSYHTKEHVILNKCSCKVDTKKQDDGAVKLSDEAMKAMTDGLCRHCGETFENLTEVGIHAECQKGFYQYPRLRLCCFCGEAFEDVRTLSQHKMVFHPSKALFYA